MTCLCTEKVFANYLRSNQQNAGSSWGFKEGRSSGEFQMFFSFILNTKFVKNAELFSAGVWTREITPKCWGEILFDNLRILFSRRTAFWMNFNYFFSPFFLAAARATDVWWRRNVHLMLKDIRSEIITLNPYSKSHSWKEVPLSDLPKK